MHLDRMPEMLEVYPDARFVWPHRDPTRALALSSEMARLRGELLLQSADGGRDAQDQAEQCFR